MRIEEITERLMSVPLFNDLSKEEIQPFVSIARYRFYKPKMYVFMQGDPLENVYFVHSGRVKIFKTEVTGKEQIVSIIEAGGMFPHAGFFRNGNYPAFAEIMDDTHLLMIPIQKFEEILISHPELCIKLFKVLGGKIIELQSRLEEQILHNTYEQIIMLLLRLCKTNGEKIGDIYRITTSFTNRELANMIGTSRETVSRTLNGLKKKKYLMTDEDGFFLINVKDLHQELL
ncbi:Crp/Fnr family transcriptional regulator [Cytobacillus sp. Hz8]|uniref:Crp/Fnr family transcriptional regulator n=1 Tax=Cytobacillus sp. Hz8 TaxID=3347168 RepID=UPI0035D9D420